MRRGIGESLYTEANFDMEMEQRNPETLCLSPRTLVPFRLLGSSTPEGNPGTGPARVITGNPWDTFIYRYITQYHQKFDPIYRLEEL